MTLLLRTLPVQHRSLTLRSASFDEVDNTIELVWTTGARVRRTSYQDGPYDEELATGAGNVRLDRLNAGAPFLNVHNAFDLAGVLGSVVPGSARMSGGQGLARIQLSRAAADADTVQKIREGVIRNVSAGYIVHAFQRTEASNGSVPVMLATDWEPLELSAVPVSADSGAQIRSSAGQLHECIIMTDFDAGKEMAARVLRKPAGGRQAAERAVAAPEVERPLTALSERRAGEDWAKRTRGHNRPHRPIPGDGLTPEETKAEIRAIVTEDAERQDGAEMAGRVLKRPIPGR